MNQTPKIAAFTIYELVVVVLLSSIVFAMGYQALSIITKLDINFDKKSRAFNDIQTIHRDLNRHFTESKAIYHIPASKQLLITDNQNIIKYNLENERWIRIQDARRDTFHLQHELMYNMYMNGSDTIWLNDLHVTFWQGKNSYSFYFNKTATAASLFHMQLEQHKFQKYERN